MQNRSCPQPPPPLPTPNPPAHPQPPHPPRHNLPPTRHRRPPHHPTSPHAPLHPKEAPRSDAHKPPANTTQRHPLNPHPPGLMPHAPPRLRKEEQSHRQDCFVIKGDCGDRRPESEKTHVEVSVGNKSALRCSSQRARAQSLALGQCGCGRTGSRYCGGSSVAPFPRHIPSSGVRQVRCAHQAVVVQRQHGVRMTG